MRERKTNAIAKIATTVVWSNRRASLAALGCCLAMITASNVRRDLTRIQTTSITTSSSGIHDIATDSQAPPEWNFDPRLICIHDVSEDGDGDDDDTSATTAATRSTRQQNPAGIVIGSQKSGTDALMKYLWQHPHIPPPKYGWRRELHFFDYYYDDDYDSNSSSSSSSSSSREVLNQTETKLAYQAEVNRNQRRPLNASSE